MRLHPSLLLCTLTFPLLLAQDPEEVQDAAQVPVRAGASTTPLLDSPALAAARQVHEGFAEISARVWPSVVSVRVYERIETSATPSAKQDGWVLDAEPNYPGYREYGALTGWVVREDGEILTCNHGLLKADGSPPDLIDFETNDFQRVVAERVGVEPTVNLAILQAMVWPNGHPRRLPALQWGDSGALRTGHWLLAFGDPSGPRRYMQVGTFISQPSRDCYQDLLSAFYMQLGLVAHPQAYGGPLVDLNGRVVGMIAPEQNRPGVWSASERLGVEFGLPSKIVEGLHEAIREVRSFRSPWLGFAVMSRPEIAKVRGVEAFQALQKPRNGILIENVYESGPAFVSGIRPNDWLVTFDSTRIFTPVDFQKQLYLAGIGTKVKVEVFRDGATSWHELEIQERPQGATPR